MVLPNCKLLLQQFKKWSGETAFCTDIPLDIPLKWKKKNKFRNSVLSTKKPV